MADQPGKTGQKHGQLPEIELPVVRCMMAPVHVSATKQKVGIKVGEVGSDCGARGHHGRAVERGWGAILEVTSRAFRGSLDDFRVGHKAHMILARTRASVRVLERKGQQRQRQ